MSRGGRKVGSVRERAAGHVTADLEESESGLRDRDTRITERVRVSQSWGPKMGAPGCSFSPLKHLSLGTAKR